MVEIPRPPAAYTSDGESLLPENSTAVGFITRRRGERVILSESEHSPLEHGFLFAFTEWLWETYWSEKFPVYENFRYYLSVCVGWYKLEMRLTESGEWVKVMERKSWPSMRMQPPCGS